MHAAGVLFVSGTDSESANTRSIVSVAHGIDWIQPAGSAAAAMGTSGDE
jgi:hypothetical protein